MVCIFLIFFELKKPTNWKVHLTSVMDWTVSSKSSHADALPTSTAECDLIWNRGSAGVKIRSCWKSVGFCINAAGICLNQVWGGQQIRRLTATKEEVLAHRSLCGGIAHHQGHREKHLVGSERGVRRNVEISFYDGFRGEEWVRQGEQADPVWDCLAWISEWAPGSSDCS